MDDYANPDTPVKEDWTTCMLKDIGGDTDKIIKMLHKHKGGNDMGDQFDMGMLTGLLQNKGIDPGLIALLNEKKDGWGDQGGIWLILLFLFLIGGNGIGGFGGSNATIAGLDFNTLNNAITAQGMRQETAISSIANTLGCSFGQVQSALAGLDKQLAMNQGSVINAIQSCCCNIGNKIDSVGCNLGSKIDQCCCQTNLNIERLGNTLGNQLNLQSQLVQKSFCDQNAYLADQFCQIKERELQNRIDDLRVENAKLAQEASTREIIDDANQNYIKLLGAVYGYHPGPFCGGCTPFMGNPCQKG